MEKRTASRPAPNTVSSPGREIEHLTAATRKGSRWGHRDATMILIGYRHGLRASELCDLRWSQVELSTGRLHVRRAKNGSPRRLAARSLTYEVPRPVGTRANLRVCPLLRPYFPLSWHDL